MKLLICGVGNIAAELLHRLGEKWKVTLVDKDETQLNPFPTRFESVVKIVAGDASSPVVLEEAGLAEHDYLIAMADSDRVNLAACKFAKEAGLRNIMALVTDPENIGGFEELGVRPLPLTGLVARNIYQYLQDPRIRVSTIGQGEVELLDVEVEPNLSLMGRPVSDFLHLEWRIAGVLRKGRLIFPDEDFVFQEGDRALVLGKADLFDEVCEAMQCAEPHFPRTYGSSLVLSVPDGFGDRSADMLKEAIHLARNTKILHIVALCGPETEKGGIENRGAGQQFDIRVEVVEGDFGQRVQQTAEEENAGVVLVPPPSPGMIDSLTRPATIAQVHELPCPLLVLRGTHPYKKILACFDGSSMAELALETALDLSRQLEAELTVAAVAEPEFLHGEGGGDWAERVMGQARELAHIDKVKIEEVRLTGNPVRELTKLAEAFNLVVIGSGRREKEVFTPHVGELLLRKCPCSILALTR
jgi:Trk K+ transport system NAD-binding subunit/nucleotide-binding universal stress UspA family protein